MQHKPTSRSYFGAQKLRALIMVTHPVAVLIWFLATILFGLIFVHGDINPFLLIRMAVVIAGSQVCIGSMNEYCDRFLDAQIKPWRPIPSGLVSKQVAIIISLASFVISLLVAVSLGLTGIVGTVVATIAGLAHDFGMKRTVFSWLPFIIGYSLHPLWVWVMTGHHLSLHIALLPIYAFPLIIGVHLADQLPDIAERNLGVYGLAHRLGPYWGPRITMIILLVAPVPMLLPILLSIYRYPNNLFMIGLLIYFSLLTLAFKLYKKRPGYASMKQSFRVIELGCVALICFWIPAVTWTAPQI